MARGCFPFNVATDSPYAARILRLLATKNIVVEVRKDCFANSHIGKVFVKNKAAQSMVLLVYVFHLVALPPG